MDWHRVRRDGEKMSDAIEIKTLDPLAQALLDNQNKRIERVELQLDNLSQRVDNLSQRIDSINENLTQRIDATNQKIDAVRSELSAKIDAVDSRIDGISKDIQSLHKWFVGSAITAVLGIGAIVASVIIKLFI